jgi:3-phenylpropionate/cinnamic acid dioxygenase small subunit
VSSAADPVATSEAAAFIIREARVLDDGDYSAWLTMFAHDCIYWVPSSFPIEDPRGKVSYLLDDRRRLEDRIALFDTGWAHAQIPRSVTQRVIASVEAWYEGPDEIRARASAVIWDHRKDTLTATPATMVYRLVRTASDREWRISIRVVHRLAITGPLSNVSFIL